MPKIGVLIVDDISDTRENLSKLLMFERDIEVIGTAGSGPEALDAARKLHPDVVLMDINMPEMDGIKAAELMSTEMSGIGIIMMSVQGEQDYLRRAMLAGAREFLVKPFSGDDLVRSIRHVYRLESNKRSMAQSMAPMQGASLGNGKNSTEESTQGRIMAVVSPKGGVGRTVLAANLAVALRLSTQKKVALVDSSLYFGDLGVMLNLLSNKTMVDAVEHIDELDADLLNDLMVTHSSGVKVLLAPPQPEMAELITAEHIRRILLELSAHYDYVVVDTWPSFADTVLTAMDLADDILLVMTLEMTAIKDVKLYLEVVEKLNYPTEKVKLVLNRSGSAGGIKVEAVEETLRQKVLVGLSNDGVAMLMAINQGVPLVISAREHPFSRDVYRLARLLTSTTTEEAQLAQATATAQAQDGAMQGKLLSKLKSAFR
ncbi:MAG TPA: response regulator [Chloroflexia bacterium]|jgi:pilus assembly protein CpaE|nr:response regulator [Chloroflexia bacterium]